MDMGWMWAYGLGMNMGWIRIYDTHWCSPQTPDHPDTQTCWGYGDISSYGKDIREIMRRDKGLWGTGEGCGGTGDYRSLWGGGLGRHMGL